MPAPTNIDDATAIALVPGTTVVQRVDDAGTTYTVVYKWANDTGDDQVLFVWPYNEDFPSGSGYRPQMEVYEGPAPVDEFITFNYPMGAVGLPVGAGKTLYFWIFDDIGADTDPSNLTIRTELGVRFDVAGVVVPGTLLIPGASTDSSIVEHLEIAGFFAGVIDPDASAITGFVPEMAAGEAGDIFPTTGRIVMVDEFGATGTPADDYFVCIYHPTTFALLTQTSLASSSTPPDGRMHVPSERYYLLRHMGGGATFLCYVEADGTLTELHEIETVSGADLCLAVNNDETIAYIGNGFPQGPIKAWDMVGETLLANFAAQVNQYYVTDLLVLPDDAVVACYFRRATFFGGVNQVFVRCYESDGSTRWTYTPVLAAGLTSTNPRLGYSADATKVWFFAHLVTGRSDIRSVAVADGSELVASITPDVIETDDEDGTQEIPYSSDSCPILELRVFAEVEPTASITVTKVVAGSDADSTEFTFVAGGGLSPGSFTLQAGESFTYEDVEPGSGYSIVETTPDGWGTPSVVVSNASPSVNLTVGEGEAVTVTVTNAPDVCECCVSTRLDITNHALAKLGQTRFITDLDEATAEGYTAAQLWDLALHAALRHFPWAFATKYAGGDPSDVEDGYMNLIDGSTSDYAVLNEWVYAYRYPVDCMFARRIVPPDGTGRGYSPTPIPFRVGRTWNGTNDVPLIYTNQEDAVLEYTALVECSEDFFDALFEDFLSWRLAGLMAPGLTRTAKTATECYQMAMLLLDQARAVASQEQQQEPNGQATWLQDR